MGARPLRIKFDEINEFIKVYDGIILFGPEQYDAIYNKTRYLISKKIVLQILLAIILQIRQESELIQIIIFL